MGTLWDRLEDGMIFLLFLAAEPPGDTPRELSVLFNKFLFSLNQLGGFPLSTAKNLDWYNK
jgi:hypothetical protein